MAQRNDLERECLGTIWRICDEMGICCAEWDTTELFRQYNLLKKQMTKLGIIQEAKGKG